MAATTWQQFFRNDVTPAAAVAACRLTAVLAAHFSVTTIQQQKFHRNVVTAARRGGRSGSHDFAAAAAVAATRLTALLAALIAVLM